MSLPYFTRLKHFSGYLSHLSKKCSINYCSDRCSLFKRSLLFKQQVDGNISRWSHTGNMNMGAVNVPADYGDRDLHEFNNSYEAIQKAFCHTDDKELADAIRWSAKALDYNVQGGKKTRGVTVLKALKVLLEDEITSEKMLQACVLGWCIEMLQGFLLMCDDIMDNSTMRRGKLCWYKLPEVGLIAINDSLLLNQGIYKILKFYFEKSEVYINILHEFMQATHNTMYGQCLDMLNAPPNTKPRFENFNLKKYHTIVKYKTAYYTFSLPVHLAMHLVGNFSEKEFEDTKNICMKLGILFQIQDDYLDVFGDPNVTGKFGTDIADGKCTWFSAYFFEHAPESMKEIMMANYGVDSEDAVSKVMSVYKEFKLEEKYLECEESSMKEITLMINQLPRSSLQGLFTKILQKMYQRKK